MNAPFIVAAPGVYEDVPAASYHSALTPGGPSLSATRAKVLLAEAGPAKYRHLQDNPEEKDAYNLGSAAHCFVLGKDADRLVTIDADSYRSIKAQAARDAAYAEGKTPLLPQQIVVAQDMANALHKHGLAMESLAGETEVSMFHQLDNGLWIRGRIDVMADTFTTDYKGLALDTPIPTPTGWVTMADIKQGDTVLDSSGAPCRVAHKSSIHHRTCYRIQFDDGSTVVCDDEHRWVTKDVGELAPSVKTAREIGASLRKYGKCQHRIAVAGALRLPDVDLPIDPYVLGCWLGDGTSANGQISKPDDELFRLIEARGYRVAPIPPNAQRCPTRTIYGLVGQLRNLGVLGNKHIPALYLRASATQRLDLLRGLMDTDGSWNATRTQAVFTTMDGLFARAVCELALSLGQRAIVSAYSGTGFGKPFTAYRVTFRPVAGLVPFSLTRKSSLVDTSFSVRSATRLIVAVEPVETVPTQCIEVDSPDSTYLCTESMIPTHNTTRDASSRFLTDAFKLGYHIQAAWYRRMRYWLTGELLPYRIVAQESAAPYLVSVWEFDTTLLELGEIAMDEAITIYRDCLESGHWPGYPTEIQALTLPEWAMSDEIEID